MKHAPEIHETLFLAVECKVAEALHWPYPQARPTKLPSEPWRSGCGVGGNVKAGRLEGIDKAQGGIEARLPGKMIDRFFDIVTGGPSGHDRLSVIFQGLRRIRGPP